MDKAKERFKAHLNRKSFDFVSSENKHFKRPSEKKFQTKDTTSSLPSFDKTAKPAQGFSKKVQPPSFMGEKESLETLESTKAHETFLDKNEPKLPVKKITGSVEKNVGTVYDMTSFGDKFLFSDNKVAPSLTENSAVPFDSSFFPAEKAASKTPVSSAPLSYPNAFSQATVEQAPQAIEQASIQVSLEKGAPKFKGKQQLVSLGASAATSVLAQDEDWQSLEEGQKHVNSFRFAQSIRKKFSPYSTAQTRYKSAVSLHHVSDLRFAGASLSSTEVLPEGAAVPTTPAGTLMARAVESIKTSLSSLVSAIASSSSGGGVAAAVGGAVVFLVIILLILVIMLSSSNSAEQGTVGSLSGVPAQIYTAIKKEDPKATNQGIAAVLGNWGQESTFSPTAINPDSGASGVGQWLGSREAALHNFAIKKGEQWDNLDLQIDFFLNGDDGQDIATAKKILEETDVTQATTDFYEDWERPGSSDPTLPKRISAAKNYLAQMSSGGSVGKVPPMGMSGNPYPEYDYLNADGSGNGSGNCTAFVWAYFKQDLGTTIPTYQGNASAWVAYANSELAKDTIAVFPPNVDGAGAMGHVAVVTAVNSDGTFDVIEGGWNGNDPSGWGHTRTEVLAAGVSFINPKK